MLRRRAVSIFIMAIVVAAIAIVPGVRFDAGAGNVQAKSVAMQASPVPDAVSDATDDIPSEIDVALLAAAEVGGLAIDGGTFRLERITISAGETASERAGGAGLLVVESGEVTIATGGDSRTLADGGQIVLPTADTYAITSGDAAATVLRLTLTPPEPAPADETAGTPFSTTPVAGGAPALLISGEDVQLDSRRGTLFIASVVIPAAAELGQQVFTGPVGVAVESGAISVIGAATTDLSMETGSSFLIPGLSAVDVVNDGDEPATLLVAGILAPVTGNATGPTATATSSIDRVATVEAENAELQSNLTLRSTSEANAYATVEAQSTAIASAESALASAEAELTAALAGAESDAATAQAQTDAAATEIAEGDAALASAEAGIANAEATLTAVSGALETAQADATTAAEEAAAAASEASDSAASLEATITALQAENSAQTTAATDANATIEAQEAAIANANATATAQAEAQATADAAAAGSLANAEATSAAYATSVASAAATASAESAALNATIVAQSGEAQSAAATASANAVGAASTIAAQSSYADGIEGSLATAIAQGVSADATIAALSTAQAETSSLAVTSVNPEFVDVSVQINLEGVIAADQTAITEAQAALQTALAPYQGCRAGVVLTFGHGNTIGQGTVLARAVNAVIQERYEPIFGGAAFDAFGDLRPPLGQVDIRIYFFTGCAAAEAGTPAP